MGIYLEDLGLPSDLRLWHAIVLTAASAGVGVLGGFVGLALGSMRLPLLLFLGMPVTTAAGTNILVSSLSAMSGSYRHLREKRVDLRVVLAMGIPSVAGAFAGAFWSRNAPESLLLAAITLLVAWQGVEFVQMARKEDRAGNGGALDGPQPPSGIRRFGVAGAIGLSIGVLGGAVGLILGSIRLPALVRILRMDLRVVAGTNLLIGFFMGVTGWAAHASRGEVDYPILALMGVSGMAGSYYGARLTGRASRRTLLLTMGWVMMAVGLALGWQVLQRAVFD